MVYCPAKGLFCSYTQCEYSINGVTVYVPAKRGGAAPRRGIKITFAVDRVYASVQVRLHVRVAPWGENHLSKRNNIQTKLT